SSDAAGLPWGPQSPSSTRTASRANSTASTQAGSALAALPDRVVRVRSAAMSVILPRLGTASCSRASQLELIGDRAEHLGDLPAGATVRMPMTAVGVADPVEHLDQVLDDHRHRLG